MSSNKMILCLPKPPDRSCQYLSCALSGTVASAPAKCGLDPYFDYVLRTALFSQRTAGILVCRAHNMRLFRQLQLQ